jgi:hypothetical protein
MNLQRRDLQQNLSGDYVHLLQSELAQLGLAVPDAERQRAVFGSGTRKMVVPSKKAHELKFTSLVIFFDHEEHLTSSQS